jgi:glycyl-tRNA synthetase alpha chain
VDHFVDIEWAAGVKYGQIFKQAEQEFSKFNFELADVALNFRLFDDFEKQCQTLLAAGVVLPAYDYCMKCSHCFNLLDARGAISTTERQRFIGRVRALAKGCAELYVKNRAAHDFPLLGERGRRAREVFEQHLPAGVSAAAVAAAAEARRPASAEAG